MKPIKSYPDHRAARHEMLTSRIALMTLCVVLIVGVFAGLALWQGRAQLFERKHAVAMDVVQSVESMIDRVALEHASLMPLVGIPCDEARQRLSATDAFIPYVRTGALVADGVIYCASSYGATDVPLSSYFSEIRRDRPSYRLVRGTLTQPGRPSLLAFFPDTVPDALGRGVLFYLDGAYLSDILRNDSRFGMDQINLRDGNVMLTLQGAVESDKQPPTASASRFPLEVVVHPSPRLVRDIYQHQLTLFIPIGIAFAALFVWLMSNSFTPRRTLLRAVRAGIARHEFDVHYQPVVELGTGVCVGVEALVRWSHPRWGVVSPNDFIGVVEGDPLIVPMTRMVVERALDELHQQKIPRHLHLAVNLAPRHLQSSHAIADLARLLASHGRGRPVIAEVTERYLFDDPQAALASFETLRKQGVRFALDDFGTDRSTLAQLQDFHFDYLKIDQRFVAELEDDRTDLIRGIIALARQIGLTLIAEGIETMRQHRSLLELGVAYGQGFFYAQPMSAASLARWLALGSTQALVSQGHSRSGAALEPAPPGPRSSRFPRRDLRSDDA
ncbi:EAL domain-containing protein [Pararobbsia alpina]|uniref:EAL domain-containing protein n=1 Tax=Pararobbsia alpina TaxID=621374 RepID=UPI0015834B93|nr:EAL domain-containing protein [Pararobbsia alpina]